MFISHRKHTYKPEGLAQTPPPPPPIHHRKEAQRWWCYLRKCHESFWLLGSNLLEFPCHVPGMDMFFFLHQGREKKNIYVIYIVDFYIHGGFFSVLLNRLNGCVIFQWLSRRLRRKMNLEAWALTFTVKVITIFRTLACFRVPKKTKLSQKSNRCIS